MDTLTKEQRHINMSRIKGKDTSPEVIVRKYLFSKGLRYRKNVSSLPGKPDIVFPKYKTVIFINGCFWHGHEGCSKFRIPKTNIQYWESKIINNKKRDVLEKNALEDLGWQVITVWECEISRKSKREQALATLLKTITNTEKQRL